MDSPGIASPSGPGATARRAGSRWRRALLPVWRNRLFVVGALVLGPLIFMAVATPLLTGYDPTVMDTPAKLQAPSLSHPFGTDEFGRDLFARVMYGSRISLRIAAAA